MNNTFRYMFSVCRKVALVGVALISIVSAVHAQSYPVEACVLSAHPSNADIASCLGWQDAPRARQFCHGYYVNPVVKSLTTSDEIQLQADHVSFSPIGRSTLKGHVEVRETSRIMNAQTAVIYRDAHQQITRIELFDHVRYNEPDRLMIAKHATFDPRDRSGVIEEVLYRFHTTRESATLPAWGRARLIQRDAHENYVLRAATYSTCSPRDPSWQIEADDIALDHAKETGVAKNALLRVKRWPVVYVPYLSFPTSKVRKSGLLAPTYGYSNVGGWDLNIPYYWNIAPNYDAVIEPHPYTRRGMMLGGDVRFLTTKSEGSVSTHVLPQDRAFKQFVADNQAQYPILNGVSSNRWAFAMKDNTQWASNMKMHVDYQQVSDDYYLQDFNTNLAVLTENQLLRQGDVSYTTDHWLFRGMLQGYQTLHPVNQSTVDDIYQRLPQLLAQGTYYDLPFNTQLYVLGQYDQFQWTSNTVAQPQGPRFHLNPVLSLPLRKPWGYVTPEVQLVENNYRLQQSGSASSSFDRAIPRYDVDSGLTFERNGRLFGEGYTQTFEPRFFYLNVPYTNQSLVPTFDSAYMIFNTDQLFRTNRFSGFDRIGDANQLAYGATSRWISAKTGREQALLTIGQVRYFADRRVQLCYNGEGNCIDDPLTLGYLSQTSTYSPIASKAMYQLGHGWAITSDYVWDVATRATNNTDVTLHFQPAPDRLVRFSYAYLVNGNIIDVQKTTVQDSALNQLTFAYAWPFNEKWSSLGAYGYNLSKGYEMITFAGIQYENCCWAARILGGRTFQSLNTTNLTPRYNNNIYFQILLKGLGSVGSSSPASTIQSYLPGYVGLFDKTRG